MSVDEAVTADRRRWRRTFDSGDVLHRLYRVVALLLLLLLLLLRMIDVLDVNVAIERHPFIGLRSVRTLRAQRIGPLD
jgi:hypothetical protein